MVFLFAAADIYNILRLLCSVPQFLSAVYFFHSLDAAEKAYQRT